MAKPNENSPESIPMLDIGLESMSQTFDLAINDANNEGSLLAQHSSYLLRREEPAHETDSSNSYRPLLLDKRQRKSSTTKRTTAQGRIHWLYPALMILALLAGLLLSIGYHVYYRWLDGRVVGSATKQQWSLR
jgi:hypothetical protein